MSCFRLLGDDAENVKPRLRLRGNAASREYVTVKGYRGKNVLLSAIFRVEYLSQKLIKSRGAV